MIAEPRARLKGCATEALKLLMGYCYDTIRISKFVAKIGKHNLKSYSLFKNKVGSKSPFLWHHMIQISIYDFQLKFKFESESEIFEEFTMELIIDEKGRKVIDVPFLNLERNPNWTGDKEMPYLKPADEFILPKEMVEETAAKEDKPENMYLCTENDGDEDEEAAEEDPEAKKRKLHFGGLNLKKKKSDAVKPDDNFASAPDTFDEW